MSDGVFVRPYVSVWVWVVGVCARVWWWGAGGGAPLRKYKVVRARRKIDCSSSLFEVTGF